MEPEDKFTDIKEVFETPHTEKVNDYLKLGWRLLRVLTRHDDYDYASYVLGWPGDEPPKRTQKFYGGRL